MSCQQTLSVIPAAAGVDRLLCSQSVGRALEDPVGGLGVPANSGSELRLWNLPEDGPQFSHRLSQDEGRSGSQTRKMAHPGPAGVFG